MATRQVVSSNAESLFVGLAQLSDELKRIGSLQSAADEAEARIAAAAAKRITQIEESDKQRTFAEAQLADAQAKIAVAARAADKRIAEARREADAVAAAAYADADKVAADVSARLAKEENDAQVRLAGLRDAAFALEGKIRAGEESAQKAADELAASIAMKRQVDAEVSRLKGLFGGGG